MSSEKVVLDFPAGTVIRVPGESTYDLYVAHGGTMTEAEWLADQETNRIVAAEAAAAAVASKASVDQSEVAIAGYRDEVAAARDIVLAAAEGVAFSTPEEGIAATDDGDTFIVSGNGTGGIWSYLYRNEDDVAVLVDTYANKEAVDAAVAAGAVAVSKANEATAAAVQTAADTITTAALKLAAESARDASVVNAQLYASEAAGRAAVADGFTFDVQGSGNVASTRYRRINSTTSVLIASYPAAAIVETMAGVVVGAAGTTIPGVDEIETDASGRVLLDYHRNDGGLPDVPRAPASGVIQRGVPVVPQSYPDSLYTGSVIPDLGRSFWVWPVLVETDHSRYFSGLTRKWTGRKSRLKIVQRLYGSTMFQSVDIGDDFWEAIGGDDHDTPCIVINPDPYAKYPLVIFQSAHSGGYSRIWRSHSPDARNLDVAHNILDHEPTTYNQAFREPLNPKRLWKMSRYGTTGGAWRIMVWDNDVDNPQPDRANTIWNSDVGTEYCLARPTETGIVFFLGFHPGSNTGIIRTAFLAYDGTLYKYEGGPVINANIWTMASSLRPETVAELIYDPGAGRKARMTGVQKVADKKWQICVFTGDVELISASPVLNIGVDFTGGAPVVTTKVASLDGGRTVTSAADSYIAGGDIIAQNKMLVCRYNTAAQPNKTIVSVIDTSGNGAEGVETVIEIFAATPPATLGKKMRATAAAGVKWDGSKIVYSIGNEAMLIHAEEYQSFATWKMHTHLLDIGIYQ